MDISLDTYRKKGPQDSQSCGPIVAVQLPPLRTGAYSSVTLMTPVMLLRNFASDLQVGLTQPHPASLLLHFFCLDELKEVLSTVVTYD